MMKRGFVALLAPVLLFGMQGTASAKDAVALSIPLGGAPDAIQIDENGNPYAAGTYAVGTLKVHYTNVATSWEPGPFQTFTLQVNVKEGKAKPATKYPAFVTFRQAGSGLQLQVTSCSGTGIAFSGSTLRLDGPSSTAACTVNVSIPSVDASLNFDGALLSGNLQVETPAGTHLDTVTLVQVRAMLVFPTAACLRLFNVITNQGVGQIHETLGIELFTSGAKEGQIKGTVPSEPADVVYVVNTCGDGVAIDLQVTLADKFAPNGPNPMAVFSSTSFDPDTDTLTNVFSSEFSQIANGAYAACIANKTVNANSTLLFRIKMALTDTDPAALPSSGEFEFASALFEPATTCATPFTSADPNEITLIVPFAIN